MLAIHDCTFQVSWRGWGPFTPHAERVAVDIMVELQEMSPEGVQRLARSPRELNLTGRVARARLAVILAHRNRVTPKHADIVLEAL
jgi:hypothetical protein